jgi:hypothetical protein
MIKQWNKLIQAMLKVKDYGLHANDMTLGEIEEELEFAIDAVAKANDMPTVDWDNTEYDPENSEA